MAKVIGIEEGLTISGRHPYALARLDCGHLASVEMLPARMACYTCGKETDKVDGMMTCCGSRAFTYLKPYRNAHVEADRLTKVGHDVDCTACAREAERLEWLRALDVPVHHARFRHGSYHLYKRDETSPTGVFLIGSVPSTPAIEALLREKRISPLSPTEGW